MMLIDDIQKTLGGYPLYLLNPQGKQIVLDIQGLIHMLHGHRYSLDDILIPVRVLFYRCGQICQ